MNRLQYESSPYLKQHAHNPVDWYPWSEEALERARKEQKPILVSIGYSTCHWCHVMERESFENEDVAAFMNEFFINIKVDREERPDVDAIYMEACQLITGSGGWPLNCFLTPDTKPFYAGTYFPPRPAHNRPSWMQVLEHLNLMWETKRATVLDQADRLLANIRRNDQVFLHDIGPESPLQTSPADFSGVFNRLRGQFDLAEGGFGGAPKFPSSMALQWLLHWAHFSRQPEAREHALFSIEKMISGGIYDQIGGGFARYATDRAWLVPHFEKMLYDNALLISLLSTAVKSEPSGPRKTNFVAVIEQTMDYIEREMSSPEGGFYSAQDADSEGHEGKFYVWDKQEIEAALGADSELFCEWYGVSEQGNWEGRNVLWRPESLHVFSANRGLDPADVEKKIRANNATLLHIRAQRVWPGLDDKILLGWNALMISACVHAFTALGKEKYRQMALRNLEYLHKNFRLPEKGRWRHSASQEYAFLDDLAWLIAAWIDVYQVTFDQDLLIRAAQGTQYVLDQFLDPESGLFFYTDSAQSDILFRKKDLYDNATPSGNSTMAHNLLKLSILLDKPEWRQQAEKMLAVIRPTLEKYPQSFARWVDAWLLTANPIHEIAVVGTNAEEKALAIQGLFIPNMVIAASKTADDSLPLLAGKPADEDAMIYVCRDFACQRPVSTMEAFQLLVNSA